MAWQNYKKTKGPPPFNAEEKADLQEKLNIYKKIFKPLKGKIVCRSEMSLQEFVFTSRYFNEDDLSKDAEDIVRRMIDCTKSKWTLISAEVVGKASFEDEEDKKAEKDE